MPDTDKMAHQEYRDDTASLQVLEERMTNGEQDIAEIKQILKDHRESVEGLKVNLTQVQLQIATQLGELRGGLRVLIALGSVALAVITIGLTVLAIILKR